MTNPNDAVYGTELEIPDIKERAKFHGGLTKREYFAAIAMQGIVSAQQSSFSRIEVSVDAVGMADALIYELNKMKADSSTEPVCNPGSIIPPPLIVVKEQF